MDIALGEPDGAGQWEDIGPDLSVHFTVTGSHHRHEHRDPVTGIRTAVCRCTGSSPQGSRSSRGQPPMSRLSCTHAATRHGLDARANPGSGRVGRRKGRQGLRWLASAN